MIATCERISEDKLKEMDRLFKQMTVEDRLEPEALTYNHLIYGCVGSFSAGVGVRTAETRRRNREATCLLLPEARSRPPLLSYVLRM